MLVLSVIFLSSLFFLPPGKGQFLSLGRNITSPEKLWLLQFQDQVERFNGTDLPSQIKNVSLEERRFKRGDDGSSWFIESPLLPLVFAESEYIPDGECKRQAKRFLKELRNGTLWAVQMFDASTKQPTGVVHGQTKFYGNFDQCYGLHYNIPSGDPDLDVEEISGKYCLVDVQYQRKDQPAMIRRTHSLDFDPNDSVWEAIREGGDFRRTKRYALQMALCVPASCTHEDIEAALKTPLKLFGDQRNLNIRTEVKPQYCQTLAEAPKFSTGGKVLCGIFLSLIVLMIASSWYDNSLGLEELEEGSATRDLLLAFSMRRNVKRIMEVQYTQPGLDSIHLIRFTFMCFVLLGHRAMELFFISAVNTDYIENAYNFRISTIITNGPIIVDGFFGIGGLLTAYYMLEELDRKKKFDFVSAIALRYLRLTPAYILMICFYAYILPTLGSGPLWKAYVERESSHCQNNWWTGILYINNYVNDNEFCMFQSWYLTVDFHAYIISLFIIYIFWRLPRTVGYIFLGGYTAGTAVMPFLATYVYREPPLYRLLLTQYDVKTVPDFVQNYTKTHLRLTPYFVGVIIAAILHDHRGSTWRLPKVWSRISFILLCVVSSIMAENIGHKYFDPNSEPWPVMDALYAALHRGVFALSTCAIVLLLTIGEGLDFHQNFFTPAWVQPLSRLTYAAFLVHNINQMYQIGVRRTAITATIYNFAWNWVPDIVYTFTIAFFLTTVVEAPFRRIERRFFNKKRVAVEPNVNSVSVFKKTS